MAYVKEVEWKGKIYDLFDKEARVKIQNLLDTVNNMDSNKANQADFENYKTTNDEELKKKVDKEDSDKIVEELKKQLADKDKAIIDLSIKNTTDKDSSCVINDSTSKKIRALTLYGNSIQSAVPTPTALVNIDNVTNLKIKLYHKNLFDFSVCNINANSSATINSVDRDNCTINFTTSETDVNSGIYLRHLNLNKFNKGYGIDYTKLANATVTLSFDCQSNVNAQMVVQLVSTKSNIINVTTNNQRYSISEIVDVSKLNKAITFYFNNVVAEVTISNIQIEVGSIATDYEECNVNQVSADCTLCAVNNIADTLTVNADGTGYITQNLLYERITSGKSQSGHTWRYSTTSKRFYRDDTRFKANYGVPNLLCSHFKVADNERDTTLDETIGFTTGTGTGIAIRMLQFDGDIISFESWLDSNEVYVLVPLANPIITELSKDEVDKILSLHTYYPSTTVICDSNFVLTYSADTKNYIDNKFNELAQVIVASADESEVM